MTLPEVAIEAEPVAFALRGYGLGAWVAIGRQGWNVGYADYRHDVPGWVTAQNEENDGFEVFLEHAFEARAGRIWRVGLLLAGTLSVGHYEYSLAAHARIVDVFEPSVGLRAGWRLVLPKTPLYATPWLSATMPVTRDGDPTIRGRTADLPHLRQSAGVSVGVVCGKLSPR